MSRDPFANYDAWKTTDQDYEDRCARADWEDAHTTYEMECCGAEVSADDLDWNHDGTPCARRCPECVDDETGTGLFEKVKVVIEEPPTAADYYDEEPDDRDYDV